MKTFGDIHVSVENHVALVMMARPPHNTVGVEMARDLADALEALDAEGDARAVILASTGKSFCAGAELGSSFNDPVEAEKATQRFYQEVVRLHATALPIVAAVNGPAIGAGVGLSLIGDFRIASPEARFAVNFVKIGFHPGFGLSHTLPRVIGERHATMMMLTGRRLKAQEAFAIGLVDQIVPASELLAAAGTLAAEIAKNAPLAVRSTRRTLRRDLAEAVRQQIAHEFSEQKQLMQTEDFREGLKAVLERRPGHFMGR
jgi:enoyl-CoA hydratase/carnithine racemase